MGAKWFSKNFRYIDLPANKNDLNLYAKISQTLGSGFSGFLDVQGRFINYHISGFEDHPQINIAFFNPKAGFSFNKNNFQAYASFSVASKEPNRNDFEAGTEQQPKSEILHDVELGIEKKYTNVSFGATLYYMHYRNQLVATGKINDVGAYTRTNTPNSYRMGAELEAAIKFDSWLNFSGNISFSRNKIKSFTEYIDDYDNGGQQINIYRNTDISFSPAIVSASAINIIPLKNSEISLQSKYVSRQFLDNTSMVSRSIDPYMVQDIRASYTLHKVFFKEVNFILQVNNVFNKKYESSGYTFNYFSSGALVVENYYFPMAGINFLAAINIKL